MRYRLDAILGTIETGFLPTWMRSLQSSTTDRLNFTKAIVLAYVKPGEAKRIIGKLKNTDFSGIHYQVDRYYVDPIYAYDRATVLDGNNTKFKDISLDSDTLSNKYIVFQDDQ